MPRQAPNPSTLEEAREMLLRYNDELNQRDQQIETLTTTVQENERTIDDLRTLNQKLYLRLPQDNGDDEQGEKEEVKESLEDFARTLKGVIR